MPLLVEKQMAADYHLVVVVGASEETRLRRLVELRGMPEAANLILHPERRAQWSRH